MSGKGSALVQVSLGFSVFPLSPRSKVPLIAGGRGCLDATKDEGKIGEWWEKEPNANAGVACGEASGVFVVDVDTYKGASFEQLLEASGLSEATEICTRVVKTARGGLHYYFKYPFGGIGCKNGILPGIDIKGAGGYVVAAGAVTDDGPYVLIADNEVEDCPIQILNLLVDKMVKKNLPAALSRGAPSTSSHVSDRVIRARKYISTIPGAVEGNDGSGQLMKVCRHLRGFGLSDDEMYSVLSEDYNPKCVPPWSEKELWHKIKSAAPGEPFHLTGDSRPPTPSGEWDGLSDGITNSAETPRELDLTDVGNGERLARRYAGNFRYVKAWGKWIHWNGTEWEIDALLAAQRLASELGHEVEEVSGGDRKALHAKSYQGISNAVKLSACADGISLNNEDLDKQHMMLPVANGVVSLANGELLPHSREMLYTKRSPVAYDPGALCPRWDLFLREIFNEDQELVDAIQRAVGYSLTGSVDEQKLFFLHGGGRNGKSTFIETIASLLGSLAAPAPRGFLELKNTDGHETSLTVLFGRRLIFSPETTQGRRLDETMVKQLTGGDSIVARRMREDHWTFTPTHKVWVIGNHKPVISGTDDGIWRRILLVPFDAQIQNVDSGLKAKLAQELPGILAWAVRGAVEWQRVGLAPPASIIAASAAYRKEQDIHRQFIDEACVVGEGYRVTATKLRAAYETWCKENGVQPLGARQFNDRIRVAGGTSQAVRIGGEVKKGWANVGLVTTNFDEM